MLFRLLVKLNDDTEITNILVDSPSFPILNDYLSDVGDTGYRLVEVLSCLYPDIKTAEILDQTNVILGQDTVLRWNIVE